MKLCAIMVAATILFSLHHTQAACQPRQCIDYDWQYIYGQHSQMPTESEWQKARTLNLPHDWSVELPFDTEGDYQKGFLQGGEAWYKHTLHLQPNDREMEIYLYFEGVYNHARVYVNGHEAAFNHYGYQSFVVPISRFLNPEGNDKIVVKCENKGMNTRWYSGSGIFRHVWLMRKPQAGFLSECDTSIATKDIHAKQGDGFLATLQLNTAFNATGRHEVSVDVTDADGRICGHGSVIVTQGKAAMPTLNVQSAVRSSLQLNPDETLTHCTIDIDVDNAKLWTAETPILYYAHAKLDDRDEIVIPFGIRQIEYSLDKGLLVNGESVLLRGACVHHDHGLLGAAAWDDAELRKIELLKQNGFNAVRCSHNLPSEAMLRMCDSLGMYVIDECFDQWYVQKNRDDYSNYFPTHYLAELETMLRRDRNHPSIIAWSIGNEIPGRSSDESINAARNMRDIIRQFDHQHRPITAALCYWDNTPVEWRSGYYNKVSAALDIVGYNYMWGEYDYDVEHHQQMMWGTETYPKEASQNWNLVEKHTRIVGDFVWTAIDYLGEAGIGHGLFVKDGEQSPFFMPYPYFNGWCGDIDLIGQKKPQSYYRDVVWRRSPITMAVELPCPDGYHREISGWGWQPEVNAWEDPKMFFTPHNLPNIMYDGQNDDKTMKALTIPKLSSKSLNVNVYSRSPQVRLYLNGRLIGTKATSDTYHAGFSVDYEPGILRAVEFENGKESAEFVLKTAGKPAELILKVEKYNRLHYITAELVDRDGNIIHDYERTVAFEVKGAATILAAGNANPTDMHSFRTLTPCLYDGRAMAIVEPVGQYTIIVKSKGLKAVCDL